MAYSSRLVCGIVVFTLLLTVVDSEIHRAKALRGKGPAKTGPRHVVPEDSDSPRFDEHSGKPGHSRETWVYSMISAVLIGLSGIFPLLVIPLEAGKALRKGAAAARLKLLLSFAVGGLLGDVFLHLLPEAWKHVGKDVHAGHMAIGLWVLAGIFTFLLVEKIFPGNKDEEDEVEKNSEQSAEVKSEHTHSKATTPRPTQNGTVHQRTSNKKRKAQNGVIQNGHAHMNGDHAHTNGSHAQTNGKVPHTANGFIQNGIGHKSVAVGEKHTAPSVKKEHSLSHIKTSGWLNLMANVIDNFTHGLAVAGSYCAGTKSGVLTTIIILLHEIPHEVGDFAILLRSGFDRWAAARAQLLTATGGLFGALVALMAESASSAGDAVAWILPFTSGGFIYIALVSVVPDLIKETNNWESLKQALMLIAGVGATAVVALYLDDHNLPTFEWLTS